MVPYLQNFQVIIYLGTWQNMYVSMTEDTDFFKMKYSSYLQPGRKEALGFSVLKYMCIPLHSGDSFPLISDIYFNIKNG